MKRILLLLAICFSAGLVQAQGITLGIDGGYGIPQGDFGDAYSGGGGAELRARVYPMDKLHIGVNAGYFVYPAATTVSGALLSADGNYSVIPITAGVEYYFFDKIVKPYAGLDVGLYLNSFKSTVEVLGTKSTATTSESYFGLAPNAGVMFGLSPITNLNVGIKYPTIFGKNAQDETETQSFLMFQVGLHFKIGL
jgi:hypothetical protein